MRRIIINADDFGVSSSVNEEIELMIVNHSISSTTIMANGKCLNDAIHFASCHPEVSYGVHLCLSEFDSITKSSVLHKYGLTDANGAFIRMQIFRIKRFNDELINAIQEELEAQIKVLKSYGIPLSHCDSHHHVHTIYGLHRVFGKVIKSEGFQKVRLPREIPLLNMFRYPIRSLKQQRVSRYFKHSFVTTDVFCSYSEFLNQARKNDGDVAELMCHPGHPKYLDEYLLVKTNKALNKDVRIITYNDF